jgi:predicted transposase YbfD/YdcC
MNAPTLFEALQAIPDHRTKKGRRFSLATILAISLAAMLSGANDPMAIFRWGRRLSPKALQALGADKKRKRAPCHATYHYVFQSISAADPRAALGILVKTEEGLGHVAIDGKRLRGSQHRTSPGAHMLNAFSTKPQAAVRALVVPPDSGECVEALELIKALPLEGAVVTGDAAFTMKPIVEAIRDQGGDYFLFVKANQPELQAELARAFGDVPPSEYRLRDPAHGNRAARSARPEARRDNRQGAWPHRDPPHRRAHEVTHPS